MRLVTRYLLRELLGPLFYCLSGFILLWVCLDLFSELSTFQNAKLHGSDILEFYLARMPDVLVLVLPIALLLALLYTLTDLARHHEITAIRAAGISLWRLCVPYFAVGLAATAALFALNEYCAPDSVEWASAILARRVPKTPGTLPRNKVGNLGFTNARDGRKWQIGIYNLDTGAMVRPHVIWTLPDKSNRWLVADHAVWTNNTWVFFNAAEYKESSETNSMLVPLRQTNVMAMPEFTETPDEIRSEIKLSDAIGSIISRGTRKSDIPINEIRNYLRLHPHPSGSDRRWLYTKLHGRLAMPWMCLVVVLIAIPFGAASGRRNAFVGVASSLVICFAYYVLQQVGLYFGTSGFVPSWLGAWLPNLCFGFAGLWMTMRVR
jgi:lipopolysaccharide export system permease protein